MYGIFLKPFVTNASFLYHPCGFLMLSVGRERVHWEQMVNIIRDRAHNRPKRKKIRESSVFIKKNVSISKRMLMTIRLNIFRFKP